VFDFFPLAKGAVREYAAAKASGTGTYRIEVLEVSTKGETTTAKCRRTVNWMEEPAKVSELTIRKDAHGVHAGRDFEFKYPVKVGTEWIRAPRRFWIEALDAKVETPAGKFKDCLRVAYLIAEGDGGSGERLYAPGVDLVKFIENDEAEPFTHQLVKKSG
jgi:hypothetical protein